MPRIATTTFSDKKLPVDANSDGIIDYYKADIISSSDYAPFGAQLAERSFFSETYPNSFNDKRDDPELGDWQDYGMRMYSTWQRRFPSPDPLIVYGQEYPELSTYQFASNTPIWAIDLDGLEAYFTSDGKFDRWGEKKGKDASVVMIQKAGDIKGVTLKNNSTDFKGKDITVKQFLRRSQRVYAEGGSNLDVSASYAHAQDNIRIKNGGNEEDNFAYMSNKTFDVNGTDAYQTWNDKRGKDYDNLNGLNSLEGANNAIDAVANLLMGKSSDPTNGANQWRGASLNKKTKSGKLWSDKWAEDMEKGKNDSSVLEGYGLKNRVVKDYIIIKGKSRVNLFFSTSIPEKTEKK